MYTERRELELGISEEVDRVVLGRQIRSFELGEHRRFDDDHVEIRIDGLVCELHRGGLEFRDSLHSSFGGVVDVAVVLEDSVV